jgi:tryptophan-rich sensory protein
MDRTRASIIAVGVPIGCALLGNAAAGNAVTTWYPTLRKSKLVIPVWAFIPIALLYYVMCGRILYRLLTLTASHPQPSGALVLLGSMMGANEGWNYVFLGRRSVRAGLFGMIGYMLLTVALYWRLRRTDQRSARLLLPYVAWVGYDVVYAYELWRLNRPNPV